MLRLPLRRPAIFSFLLIAAVAPAQPPGPAALPSDADLDRMILGLDPLDEKPAPGTQPSPARTPSPSARFAEGRISTATGYRRNVLFTPQNTLDSAYQRLEVDCSAFMLPASGLWSAFVAVQGEWETFYSHRDELPEQSFAVLLTGADWRPTPRWKIGGVAQVAYSDQYVGVAVTDTLNQTVGIAALQGVFTPELQWKPRAGWKFSLLAPLERDLFDTESENYRQAGGGASLGRSRGAFDISVQSTLARRNYDERNFRTDFGFAVVDSRLRWLVWENKVVTRLKLGPDKAWNLSARFGHRRVTDGEYGYDNHQRFDTNLSATWERGPWNANVSASAAWVRYDVQGVSLFDRNLRSYATVAGEANITRKFSAHWSATAAARWENLDSNRPGDDYTVQSLRLGVNWLFEAMN